MKELLRELVDSVDPNKILAAVLTLLLKLLGQAFLVLVRTLRRALPHVGRWIACNADRLQWAAVDRLQSSSAYYPGSMLMSLIPKVRHPLNREMRAELEFSLGWNWNPA